MTGWRNGIRTPQELFAVDVSGNSRVPVLVVRIHHPLQIFYKYLYSDYANMWYEHYSYKVEIVGSTPTVTTNNVIKWNKITLKQIILSGCSAVGSAPRSGRGGRRFESSHPDQFGLLVIMVSTAASHAAGTSSILVKSTLFL